MRSPRNPSPRRKGHAELIPWFTGATMVLCMLMSVALAVLVVREGIRTFWPDRIVFHPTQDGTGFEASPQGHSWDRTHRESPEVNEDSFDFQDIWRMELDDHPTMYGWLSQFTESFDESFDEQLRQYDRALTILASLSDLVDPTEQALRIDVQTKLLEAKKRRKGYLLQQWLNRPGSEGSCVFRNAQQMSKGVPVDDLLDGTIERRWDTEEEQWLQLSRMVQEGRELQRKGDSYGSRIAEIDREIERIETRLAKHSSEPKDLSEIRRQTRSIEESVHLEDICKKDQQALEFSAEQLEPSLRSWMEGLSKRRQEMLERDLREANISFENEILRKRELERLRELAVSRLFLVEERNQIQRIGTRYRATMVVPRFDHKLALDAVQWNAMYQGQSIDPMQPSRDSRKTSFFVRKEADILFQVLQADGSIDWGWATHPSNDLYYGGWFAKEDLLLAKILVAYQPNRMTWAERWSLYGSRWRSFLSSNPRNDSDASGVFPAIWGTIVLTLSMTILVIPCGIIAALYLREYSRSNLMTSLVRICINNLAGVPSIVYGVFGLVFFCQTLGAYIDGGPERIQMQPLPEPSWYALLAVTAASGTLAFLLGVTRLQKNTNFHFSLRLFCFVLWLACCFGLVLLMARSPFFHGFYRSSLPSSTFGHPAILWGSMTMALLTLPVVIVTTEEAIASVPVSLREGSYACGASQWQTVYRVILPHARVGILTGSILAISRGAGEVAPLMLVGAMPLAVDLPLDTEFPFFHGSRSFMHLGYQIYSLGFQGQNPDQSKSLVFTTALLLILIVTTLNLVAVWLRMRLRNRVQNLDL